MPDCKQIEEGVAIQIFKPKYCFEPSDEYTDKWLTVDNLSKVMPMLDA